MGNVLQPFTPDEARNGKGAHTITTLEIAEMMNTEHWDILRKLDGRTKDGKHYKGYVEILTDNQMAVSDYFIPSSYIDASGKENKCYNVTKLGCDFLANKFTGEKGVIFTARYVKRFDEMEDHIKAESGTPEISFKEQVQSLEAVADMLHMNDASKLLMLENFYKQYNIPTQFLPKYEHNGSREMKAPKYLLEENGCSMSSQKFNLLLIEHGFLEERERPSSKGGAKKFKALTERGLKYGENAVSPHNQKEVQPLYYADTFMELYDLVI